MATTKRTFQLAYSLTGLKARKSSFAESVVVRARLKADVTPDAEAFLSGITKSGQFTLEKTANMYAGVRRLRDPQ